MPLNNIQLNPFLVADLYKDCLVEEGDHNIKQIISDDPVTEIKDQKDQTDVQIQWKYLGDFKKNILLIVNYPSATHLPDEQLNFLTTILGACKLNLGDVAIINIANTSSGTYKNVF